MSFAGLALLVGQVTRTRFEWGRIRTNSDWILPLLSLLVVVTFVRLMYRRDAHEVGTPWRWLLTAMRMATFVGLLVLYLEPRWRTEHEVVHPSRVVLLADTSLSMGLADDDQAAGSRSRQVAAALEKSDVLRRLREIHEVVVMRFDETLGRIVTLGKLAPQAEDSAENAAVGGEAQTHIDWEKALKPIGKETRLGQSLAQAISDERSAPVAGIVLVSDGGQNSGPPPENAVELAREAKIPIYTVGVGSAQRLVNVGVYELEAPERAHPGDPYAVTALIQSQGLAKQSVSVQLFLRDPAKASEQLIDTQQVVLGNDGQSVPVKFQVTPTETGRRQVIVRVVPPKADRNAADNQREADVEIVDRKNHVLLFAGGPSREYQFVRSLLYRDKSTTPRRAPPIRQTGHFPRRGQDPRQLPRNAAGDVLLRLRGGFRSAVASPQPCPDRSLGKLGRRARGRADRDRRADQHRPDGHRLGAGSEDVEDPRAVSG